MTIRRFFAFVSLFTGTGALLLGCATSSPQVASKLLGPNDDIPEIADFPTSVILLTSRQSNNVQICDSFFAAFPVQQNASPTNFRITYWLDNCEPPQRDANCTAQMANYNFAKAQSVLNTVGKPDAVGPVFVGFYGLKPILIVDLSNVLRLIPLSQVGQYVV